MAEQLIRKPQNEVQQQIARYIQARISIGKNPKSYDYLNRFWIPAVQGLDSVRDLTTDWIEDTLSRAVERNKWKESTYNQCLIVISGFLGWCLKRRLIDTHPVHGLISLKKVDNARTRWLRPHEIRAIQQHCPVWLRDLISFSVKTGMRLSEVCDLKVKDYSVDSRDQAYLTTGVTKNGSHLVWPVEGKLRVLIEERIARAYDPEEPLFPGPNHGNAKASILRYLPDAVRAAGLVWGISSKDGITFHTFRHSMASLALNHGVPMTVVQRLGNWKTPAMVARYAHLADEVMRDAASKLDSLI